MSSSAREAVEALREPVEAPRWCGRGCLWVGGVPDVREEVGVRDEVGVRVEVGVLGVREEGVRVGVLGACVGVRVRLGVCGGESVCGGA